ncbi:MAG TPA: ester cyclase [Vicinamibacterales bacterium]|nr:ester cyclase [Vicinamibacterales bacterium]
MSAENKAIVRKWFDEVWNQGKVETIDKLLAPGAVVHGLGPAPMIGPAGFKAFHSAYRNAFPDVTLQVDDLIAEGDCVAARWSGKGTHKGDGLGFAATNKPATFSGMTIVRVQNGQLVEGWNQFDQFGMLQQLGQLGS